MEKQAIRLNRIIAKAHRIIENMRKRAVKGQVRNGKVSR